MRPTQSSPLAGGRLPGERGSMLLTAMLFSIGIALVLGSYLALSLTSLKVAHRTYFANDAANLAEAHCSVGARRHGHGHEDDQCEDDPAWWCWCHEGGG